MDNTLKVEGRTTIVNTYQLTWVNGELQIDEYLRKALLASGYEIVHVSESDSQNPMYAEE